MTSDGVDFVVTDALKGASTVLSDLDAAVASPDDDGPVARLSSIDSKTLETLTTTLSANSSSYDLTGVPSDMLFRMIEASNFLAMGDFFDAACKEAASRMGGMSVAELREYLSVDVVDNDVDMSELKALFPWLYKS